MSSSESIFLDSQAAAFDALPASMRAQVWRANALASARAMGLPTTREEAWKYTALKSLNNTAFVSVSNGFDEAQLHALLAPIAIPRLVIVNGTLRPTLSDLNALKDVISIETDADVAPASMANAFDALNTALHQSMVTIEVGSEMKHGTSLPTTLNLVRVIAANGASSACYSKLRMVLKPGANLTLHEHELNLGDGVQFQSHLTSIEVGVDAVLHHLHASRTKANCNSVQRMGASLHKNATYERLDLLASQSLSRLELHIGLDGEGAQFRSNGVLDAKQRAHLDARLNLHHNVGKTTSNVLWRGLADDRSRVVFHGGIHIHAGSDGSAAHLSNKNLLLNEHAEIDTQPVLEIDADEIQASHGATIGQLNETALFYLRSRGIAEADAKQILMQAFVREAVSGMQSETIKRLANRAFDAAQGSIEHEIS